MHGDFHRRQYARHRIPRKGLQNALPHELTKAGLMVRQQIAIVVEYDGVTVGTYAAGLLVEIAVLVEIKAVRALGPRRRYFGPLMLTR
jgi:GxxExxY protein